MISLSLVEYSAGLRTYWFSLVTNSPSDHCNMLLNSKPWTVIKSFYQYQSDSLCTNRKNFILWLPHGEKHRAKIMGLQNKKKSIVFFASDEHRKTLNKSITEKRYSLYSIVLNYISDCLNIRNHLKSVQNVSWELLLDSGELLFCF